MHNNNIRVSAVSFLNTKPFVYGLQELVASGQINLTSDNPAACAAKLRNNECDIALLPAAEIPFIEHAEIISEYGICGDGEVGSVLLLSDVPLHEIKIVLLDYQSRTSVALVQVLAENFWNISPQFENTGSGFENKISGLTAGVIIGDRSFQYRDKHPYVYDLSAEWKKNTDLPFVFACWVANKKLPLAFIETFNTSLKSGIESIDSLIAQLKTQPDFLPVTEYYLKNQVKYHLTEDAKKGLKKFMTYIPTVAQDSLQFASPSLTSR